MAQSRKKAILEEVEKRRRVNRLISFAAIALIAVVVVAVIVSLPGRGNAVPLPGYLDRCVTGTLAYHSHPGLSIVINGSTFPIPSGVGIQGACNKPIHAHDASGTLHVETDDGSRDYTLRDFFLIWGNWENNPQRAIFNSTQIFGGKTVGHTLTMTVNGSTDTSFQNLVLPRTACSSSDTCQSGFQNFQIVITYV